MWADGARGIRCDERVCAAGVDVCCYELILPPNGVAGLCLDADAGLACSEIALACDGPEDCAAGAGVCCSLVDQVVCVDDVDSCPRNIVCHTDGDCPAGTCREIPNGRFRICQ